MKSFLVLSASQVLMAIIALAIFFVGVVVIEANFAADSRELELIVPVLLGSLLLVLGLSAASPVISVSMLPISAVFFVVFGIIGIVHRDAGASIGFLVLYKMAIVIFSAILIFAVIYVGGPIISRFVEKTSMRRGVVYLSITVQAIAVSTIVLFKTF